MFRPRYALLRGCAVETFTYRPIGVIRSPFTGQEDTPIQPAYAAGARGTLEIAPEFVEALQDLEGFERIWVLYHCDRARSFSPRVVPYRDDTPHGLFATRAPSRPNPIGLSALRLLGIDGATVRVADLDVLDGTPLLDVKPYVPAFDAFPDAAAGWLDASRTGRTRADRRFEDDPPPGAPGDDG